MTRMWKIWCAANCLLMISCHSLFAQESVIPVDVCRSKNQLMKKTLSKDSPLLRAIESNSVGNGRHFDWMDNMKAQNIRQAAASVDFNFEGQSLTLSIVRMKFSSQYYYFETNSEKTDKRMLSDQLLIDELRMPFFVHALEFLESRGNKAQCGTLYLNLLDDACLPIMNDIPDMRTKCSKRKQSGSGLLLGFHKDGVTAIYILEPA